MSLGPQSDLSGRTRLPHTLTGVGVALASAPREIHPGSSYWFSPCAGSWASQSQGASPGLGGKAGGEAKLPPPGTRTAAPTGLDRAPSCCSCRSLQTARAPPSPTLWPLVRVHSTPTPSRLSHPYSTSTTPKSLYPCPWRLAPDVCVCDECLFALCYTVILPQTGRKMGGGLLSAPAVVQKPSSTLKMFFKHLFAYSKRLPAASSPRAWGRTELYRWCSNTFLPHSAPGFLNAVSQTLPLILSKKRPLPMLLVRSM